MLMYSKCKFICNNEPYKSEKTGKIYYSSIVMNGNSQLQVDVDSPISVPQFSDIDCEFDVMISKYSRVRLVGYKKI